MATYLVTGHAGFIGFSVAHRLLREGHRVVGIDNLNDYYDPSLKRARLAELDRLDGDFVSVVGDVADQALVDGVFEAHDFDRVIHLAAQAGIRYSLEAPRSYVSSNVVGFTNILEGVRGQNTPHLVYASTSSVYGGNTEMPYSEEQRVDKPLQLYAATKRANELMAHSYAHLFDLPMTGLRFFTVYGPWGRPDMALFKFAKQAMAREPIEVFNHGNHTRDFTYIDDIVDGILRASANIPAAREGGGNDGDGGSHQVSNLAPWQVFNLGNATPVRLMDYIEALESSLGVEIEKKLLPRQPGDALDTYADISHAKSKVGYEPKVSVSEGVRRFADWFRDYYG